MEISDFVGLLGVALTLCCYAALAAGKLRSDRPLYPWLNLIATCGILGSLMVHWNLASFVAQIVWIVASLASLVRIYRGRA